MIMLTKKKEVVFNLSFDERNKVNSSLYNNIVMMKNTIKEATSYNEFSKTSVYKDVNNQLKILFSLFGDTKFLKEYETELNEMNNIVNEYLNKVYDYPLNYNIR